MIKATLFYNKSGHIYRFKVRYHGDAIVCAGVSALVITCANFIQTRPDLEWAVNVRDGELIDFEIISPMTHDAALIAENMAFGLALIQQAYPGEIKIEKEVQHYD